jgi:hypothetical protein
MDETTAANDGADAFLRLDRAAKQAGASISAALSSGQVEGRKFDDVLKGVGERLASMALQAAGQGLTGALSSSLTSALGSSLVSSAAAGGEASLAAPASLTGLAQAADGTADDATRAAQPQASRAAPVSVTIQTQDADSFRRSEAQITAALARAVQRGQRGL